MYTCYDHEVSISVRLTSKENNLSEFRNKIFSHEVVFFKEGESVFENDKTIFFKAQSNGLLFPNIYTTNILDEDYDRDLIVVLEAFIKEIAIVIDKTDFEINKEVMVSTRINNQQFGFGFSLDFINLVSINGYGIDFTGTNSLY